MQADDRAVAALRKWSVLLDSAFRVPGPRVTFGLDPLLGLVPGLGDLTTPLFLALLLLHAVRLRIPRVVLLRMLINAARDCGERWRLGLRAACDRRPARADRDPDPRCGVAAFDRVAVLGFTGGGRRGELSGSSHRRRGGGESLWVITQEEGR